MFHPSPCFGCDWIAVPLLSLYRCHFMISNIVLKVTAAEKVLTKSCKADEVNMIGPAIHVVLSRTGSYSDDHHVDIVGGGRM